MLKKLIKLVFDPDYRFLMIGYYGGYRKMPDDVYLKRKFKLIMHQDLDLDDPKTFNEKLQWLKLYNRKPIYTQMVDKVDAKPYVAERLGEEYIIPTLGVWDKFDDIDFDSLPNQFVLKCSHDSGGLVICKDKATFNKKAAKKKINKCLKNNYYYSGREWPYKDVKPRILAETYMEDSTSSELNDYKLMCFNGKVKCTFVCSDRFTDKGLHVTFFDRDWNRLPFERLYPSVKEGLPKPQNYEKMVELAEILSKDIPFLRVDFYEVDGKIYFGELTFFPGSGLEVITPHSWDETLGSWIELPR